MLDTLKNNYNVASLILTDTCSANLRHYTDGAHIMALPGADWREIKILLYYLSFQFFVLHCLLDPSELLIFSIHWHSYEIITCNSSKVQLLTLFNVLIDLKYFLNHRPDMSKRCISNLFNRAINPLMYQMIRYLAMASKFRCSRYHSSSEYMCTTAD